MSLLSRAGTIRALLPNGLVYVIPRCNIHVVGLRKALTFSPGVQKGCEGGGCVAWRSHSCSHTFPGVALASFVPFKPCILYIFPVYQPADCIPRLWRAGGSHQRKYFIFAARGLSVISVLGCHGAIPCSGCSSSEGGVWEGHSIGSESFQGAAVTQDAPWGAA